MAILIQCECRRRQSAKNKKCTACGADLDKLKKQQKIKYWIVYRLPNGKQRFEYVGLSFDEARAAEGKRLSQRREGRFFEMMPESKLTFQKLAEWYLELPAVKSLDSYKRVTTCINHFNKEYGQTAANKISFEILQKYQSTRTEEGMAPATVDMEIRIVKTMLKRGCEGDNPKVNRVALYAFEGLKKQLEKGSNNRTRILSAEEFKRLINHAAPHLKNIIAFGYFSGMRVGEILKLQWKHIDIAKDFIRLPKEMTKENKPKNIPLTHHVSKIVADMPHPIDSDTYVFKYRGSCVSDIRTGLSNACENAEIAYGRNMTDGLTFHDLRRTFKTNLRRAGVEKIIRDKILGHSIKGMDDKYDICFDEDLREGMNKFEAWIDKRLAEASVDQIVDQAESGKNQGVTA